MSVAALILSSLIFVEAFFFLRLDKQARAVLGIARDSMSVLADGCTLTGVPNYVQEIVIGTIIVVAVAVDRVRSRRRA